jgi:hypothetical protein
VSFPHEPRHEELLQRLVLGDEPRPSPAERIEVERCEVCGPELESLSELRRSLRSIAGEERELLAEARRAEDVPGSAEAREFARAKVAQALALRSRRRRTSASRWLATAAALTILVLGALWWRRAARDEDLGPELGPQRRIELLEPEPGPGFGLFRWRGTLPPGGWFALEVREPADGERPARQLLTPPPRLYAGDAWSPPESESATWPDVIEWRVTSYTPSGEAFARSEFRLRRRSPP